MLRGTVYIVEEAEGDEAPRIERSIVELDVDTPESFKLIVGQEIIERRGDVGVEFGPIGPCWFQHG